MVFLALCICAAFLSCEDDSGGWEDDHTLNPALIGTWKYESGQYGDDIYIISNTRLSYENTAFGDYDITDAEIVYVYNFRSDKTAGGLIIKTAADKYTAVWFKSLSPADKVTLGAAFDSVHEYGTENYISDVSVATLEAAKERFSPKNAENWGSTLAMANPQSWVPQQ